MKMTELKYMLDEGGYDPVYAHKDDAGCDLFTPVQFSLRSRERRTIDLKIHFFIDSGFYLAIVPKSGLASKYGITVTNSPGTIDSNFTDTVKLIIQNTGQYAITFKKGAKVCQGILKKKEEVELVRVYEKPVLKDNDRGDNGLGSTGDS